LDVRSSEWGSEEGSNGCEPVQAHGGFIARPHWLGQASGSELPANARSYFDDVEVRRPTILHACERRITHGSSKVLLALLQRRRLVRGNDRSLTELRVIKILNAHERILIGGAGQGSC
jgi:hypothetical protein